MNKKSIFFLRRNLAYILFFSLFYNVFLYTDDCNGIIQQVETLLEQQSENDQSLQVIASLQDVMDKDLDSLIDILTPVKSGYLFETCSCRAHTKASRKALDTERGNEFMDQSNSILVDVNGKQITSVGQLRAILTSQFSTVDRLDDLQERLDSITDKLDETNQLAQDLGISLSDCEASLDECIGSCALWEEYMDEMFGTPDDIFWKHEANCVSCEK